MRNICNTSTLNNIGHEIIEYIKEQGHNNFRFNTIEDNHKYGVFMNDAIQNARAMEDKWQALGMYAYKDGKGSIIQTPHIEIAKDAELLLSSISKQIFSSDKYTECISFQYWINTRFVRFFVAMSLSTLKPLNNQTFRFVPAPPTNPDGTYNWTLKYTDKGLYEYYNLPQKYIDVIESVIKERK